MSTAPNAQSASIARVTIRATDRAWSLRWNEIWQHRELLYFLTWRDIKVRYKQTVLGVVWAIVQPLAIALALTMFLGRLVHVPSESLPYPVFAYAGMVLWQLFAQALTELQQQPSGQRAADHQSLLPAADYTLVGGAGKPAGFRHCLLVLGFFLAYYRIVPSATIALSAVWSSVWPCSSPGGWTVARARLT